jgi:hypothetical protein
VGAVGGLSTLFLVASQEREFIFLERILQPPLEYLCPSVNSWHGIDHGEVQAQGLTGEKRKRCERTHLQERNGTDRASQEGGPARVICFFCTGFKFGLFDFVE